MTATVAAALAKLVVAQAQYEAVPHPDGTEPQDRRLIHRRLELLDLIGAAGLRDIAAAALGREMKQ